MAAWLRSHHELGVLLLFLFFCFFVIIKRSFKLTYLSKVNFSHLRLPTWKKKKEKKEKEERKGKGIQFLYCSFPSHVPIDETNHMM
jgi:hypothetical protein